MSLILLADDSPHALRMGEQILREEGYEVVCAASGADATRWLSAVHPDVVIADAFLPGWAGADLCPEVKAASRHTRVILTAGALETCDDAAAKRMGGDAFLRKPFEASVVASVVAPLAREAGLDKFTAVPARAEDVRTEEVRALVARAVEEELPRLVEEITRKVLLALPH
jgi:DNA-binding response OmpR family regulator